MSVGGEIRLDNNTMRISRVSMLSGKTTEKVLSITAQQWANYMSGVLIQNSLKHLSDDDREFILTGILPEEWDENFKEKED